MNSLRPSYPKLRKHNAIRVGLMQIKGLQKNTISSILEHRKIEKFSSLDNFLTRTGISEATAENLIRCGACDGFGLSRPAMIWKYESSDNNKDQRQTSLLLPVNENLPDINLPEYSKQDKLLHELECLDLTVSDHIVSLFGIQNEKNQFYNCKVGHLLPVKDISSRSGTLVTIAGWLITYKRTRTVKGDLMKFITLEDHTGLVEVILLPKIYKQYGHVFQDRGPFIVKGKVQQEDSCFAIKALWIGRTKNTIA